MMQMTNPLPTMQMTNPLWSACLPPQSLTTMATTPPNTTLPLPLSTPIRINTSTTLPFSTLNRCRIESCTAMAAEMEKYLVGPMPVQQFLDDFFPIKELPHLSNNQFKKGHYDATVRATSEINAYRPFVSFSY